MNRQLRLRFSASGLKSVIMAAGFLLLVYLMTFIMPDYSGMSSFGIFSIVPAVFLIIYIFFTKRILESLILASLMGYIMVDKTSVFSNFADGLMNTMMSEDIAWLILVCGLMGSIIAMVEKAGGAYAFGEWVSKRAKKKESVMMWTWLLGIIIFLDDYLNALVIGSSMARPLDKNRTPREMLAFIVDSSAAPVCVLIPISTWGAFCGRLLEVNGWAPSGEGLSYFIKTIPYDIYAWVGILIVPLFIYKIIKPFGPMKAAEERVANGGPLAPEGSEKIDIRGGAAMAAVSSASIWDFFVPVLSLVGFTVLFGADSMELAVYATLAVCFAFYVGRGVMSSEEYWDCFVVGIKNMFNSILLMILAFLFAEVNSQIGFTYYMIHSAESWMTPQLMPVIIFIILSITEFITGTNWGMYTIALPIVIPLAMDLGANVALCVAAVISAGVFGSHVCFYSDATVVTSAACGCDNFAHAKTQMPYGILCALISMVGFVILGFAA